MKNCHKIRIDLTYLDKDNNILHRDAGAVIIDDNNIKAFNQLLDIVRSDVEKELE